MFCVVGSYFFVTPRRLLWKEVMQNMETQQVIYEPVEMGKRLKSLRKANKLSQEALAEVLNVSKDTVYNYEKGNTSIPHDCIIQLCQEFNVSADYFFFGRENPLNNDTDKIEDNNLKDMIMNKIDRCDSFDKKRILDMLDILLVERPAI